MPSDEAANASPNQPDFLLIVEDMEPDKQKAIFELVQQAEEAHGANDRVGHLTDGIQLITMQYIADLSIFCITFHHFFLTTENRVP